MIKSSCTQRLYISIFRPCHKPHSFALINRHNMHNCQPVKTQLTNAHFWVRLCSSCYDKMQLGSVLMSLLRHKCTILYACSCRFGKYSIANVFMFYVYNTFDKKKQQQITSIFSVQNGKWLCTCSLIKFNGNAACTWPTLVYYIHKYVSR